MENTKNENLTTCTHPRQDKVTDPFTDQAAWVCKDCGSDRTNHAPNFGEV